MFKKEVILIFWIPLLFFISLKAMTYPIAQDISYHNFADQRNMLGIDHFLNVLSNIFFLIIGVLGIRESLQMKDEYLKYRLVSLVFFIGVGLVGLGSGYYHLDPNNMTLVWDRLPMTIAFMAFFSMVVIDRIDARIGQKVVLPISLLLGALSILYWVITENMGVGDLRAYAFIQFFPVILIGLICWMYRQAEIMKVSMLSYVFLWYAIAKILEHFDLQFYQLTLGFVSGHSLKHVAAAIATWIVYRSIRQVFLR
ncbi:ceramidase domain-containing protein [Curvivirga sp.]|uniref:ceramidase domain-containing protein n=1 Tax=Curvivirga sp. TaxID=2856848 RepID=UPI003B5C8F02